MKRCRWCNREIKYRTSPVDDYWYHIEPDLIYCFKSLNLIAEPKKEYPDEEAQQGPSVPSHGEGYPGLQDRVDR